MCAADNSLQSVDVKRFKYSDGTVSSYVSYLLNGFDVYVFHGQVQPYSKSSVCLRIPPELSRVMDAERRQYLCLVQLATYGDEAKGAEFVFQRFLRSVGGYDCIPIPAILQKHMDRRMWTVAVSLLDKSMLLQYDGYVVPGLVSKLDPLKVCEHVTRFVER